MILCNNLFLLFFLDAQRVCTYNLFGYPNLWNCGMLSYQQNNQKEGVVMGPLGQRHCFLIKIALILACIMSFLFMQGCATIIKGKTQEVTFKSEPEGATVTVTGRTIGKTPITTQLDRKSDQTATFEKEGYKPQTIPLTTTITGWFWGNIVVGGLFGSTTDGISGSFHEYSPSHFLITLVPTDDSKARDAQRSDAKTFIVVSYKSILEELNTQPGQYLSSLMSMLKILPDQKAEFIKNIKSLADTYKDISEFADQVIKQYRNK